MNAERFNNWTDVANMKDHIRILEERVDFMRERLANAATKAPDVIGVYNGRDGRPDWWSRGCWLKPNEVVAIITVEAEQ